MQLLSTSPYEYYKLWKVTNDYDEERFPDSRLYLSKGKQTKLDASLIMEVLGDDIWAEWDERPEGGTHLHCGGDDKSALVILKKRSCCSYISDILTGPIALYAKPSPCHNFLAEVTKKLNKSPSVNVINMATGELISSFTASGFWWRPNSTLIVKDVWWEVRKKDGMEMELLGEEELTSMEQKLDDESVRYEDVYGSSVGGIIFDPVERRVISRLKA